MQRSLQPVAALASALMGLALACGDDGVEMPMPQGGDSPSPGDGDMSGDGDGDGDMDLDALWGPLNTDCPEKVPPFIGRGAQRGECCYRNEPNSLSVELQGDGPSVAIGYRMNYQVQTNHPYSLSQMTLAGLAVDRSEGEEQSLLVSFTGPRMDGVLGSGPGTITVGQGRYNCDGTYSYYAEDAAPTGAEFPGGDDPSRWRKQVVDLTFDGTKSGRAASTIRFEDNYNGRSYSLFVNADTFEREWELVTRGFDITEISTDVADLDCQGARVGGVWQPNAEFIVFAPLADNHFASNGIPLLNSMTFAQLVSFGLVGDPAKLEMLDPLGERCTPEPEMPVDQRTCPWVKLPESLCPENEAEEALFRCHVGWEGNPENEPTNCTQTAPTSARTDPNGDEGQCCDPMGDPGSGLPACNAFLLRSDVVAAAAKIVEDKGAPIKCAP